MKVCPSRTCTRPASHVENVARASNAGGHINQCVWTLWMGLEEAGAWSKCHEFTYTTATRHLILRFLYYSTWTYIFNKKKYILCNIHTHIPTQLPQDIWSFFSYIILLGLTYSTKNTSFTNSYPYTTATRYLILLFFYYPTRTCMLNRKHNNHISYCTCTYYYRYMYFYLNFVCPSTPQKKGKGVLCESFNPPPLSFI